MLTCRGCLVVRTEDTHAHVLDCVVYEDLRKGLDLDTDVDLVKFFGNVMVLRMRDKK